jgi:transcriptional regulator with XRE-family HTH domain
MAEKIHKLRLMHGYSRTEFAKICGIGYSTVCKYEIGFAEPSRRNLDKISKLLKLYSDYFQVKKE